MSNYQAPDSADAEKAQKEADAAAAAAAEALAAVNLAPAPAQADPIYEREDSAPVNLEVVPAEKFLRIILNINRGLWITAIFTMLAIFALYYFAFILAVVGVVSTIVQSVAYANFNNAVPSGSRSLRQQSLATRAKVGTIIAWVIAGPTILVLLLMAPYILRF